MFPHCTHTFYTCAKLNSFWSSFLDILLRALNVSLKPCPIFAICGVSPVDGCYIQPVPGYVTEREDHADYLILKKIYLLKIKNEQHKVNKVSINV